MRCRFCSFLDAMRRRRLVGCGPWGRKELDTTERLHFRFSLPCIGERNGNPLQCSCLENSRDRGAWWAVIYGVTQSRTQLKRLGMHACIGEGNGHPLQCSCLETSRDRGAWWAAIHRVAQSRTRLKRLSSSSNSPVCKPADEVRLTDDPRSSPHFKPTE